MWNFCKVSKNRWKVLSLQWCPVALYVHHTLISRIFIISILHHWPVHMMSLSNPLSFRTNTEKEKKKSKYKSCKWKFQLVFRLILTNQQRIKRAKIAESRRSSVACARWCKKHSNNRAAKVESLGSRKFYFYRDDIESAELIHPWKNHPRIVVQTSDARVISNHHDSAFF